MKIAFFSNYLNHHQIPLADELNKIDGVEYYFIADHSVPEFRKQLGYINYERKYHVVLNESEENRQFALKMCTTADVAIFINSGMEYYLEKRLTANKLTFLYSERWFKKRFKKNLLSPHLWKQVWTYFKYRSNEQQYMLCASAYAANDYNFLHMYRGRYYKWGYFTKTEELLIDDILSAKRQNRCRIMWCSRFIGWKHPELCIELAKHLKEDGLDFEINMFGNGPLIDKYKKLVEKENLKDCVFIKGNRKNEEVLQEMRLHNIFLFTSDQNEGWGAVANEAMSNGCTIVGSDEIGSVPFLIKDGVNGRIFNSKEIESLYPIVKNLMLDRLACEGMAKEAYLTMMSTWSPESAAKRLIKLINSLQARESNPFIEGPCSKAEPYNK